jgi:hypothetical protein
MQYVFTAEFKRSTVSAGTLPNHHTSASQTEYHAILIWLSVLILYLQQIIRVSGSMKRSVQ